MFKTIILLLIFSIQCALASPFEMSAKIVPTNSDTLVVISVKVPAEHYLYQNKFTVNFPKALDVKTLATGDINDHYDELLEETIKIYDKDFEQKYLVQDYKGNAIDLKIEFQGCNNSICFMPESKDFKLQIPNGLALEHKVSKNDLIISQKETSASANSLAYITNNFDIRASAVGYLKVDNFIDFITTSEKGTSASKQSIIDKFTQRGLIISILLTIIGGFLLNLTPCVFPMIPINLAIMGAGTEAKSRKRGFLIGSAFGVGIAVAYGLLGVIVALTGSQFGAINSTPIFNFIMALVFLILALAMFDIISIDMTKFQQPLARKWTNQGTYLAAFILGVLNALLAGACVAPVVIQVLIVSTDYYAKGNYFGILLPFLLGVGMALPWPFAGASLTFLPRPGKWMNRVKQLFGVVIIIFALYYAYLALVSSGIISSKSPTNNLAGLNFKYNLTQALTQAKAEDKDLFIDFWSTSCKNCKVMDLTTFRATEVKDKLSNYILLKYQVDDSKQTQTPELLNLLEIKGLPTYIIMRPKK